MFDTLFSIQVNVHFKERALGCDVWNFEDEFAEWLFDAHGLCLEGERGAYEIIDVKPIDEEVRAEIVNWVANRDELETNCWVGKVRVER